MVEWFVTRTGIFRGGAGFSAQCERTPSAARHDRGCRVHQLYAFEGCFDIT
jgi:hypothetical protein